MSILRIISLPLLLLTLLILFRLLYSTLNLPSNDELMKIVEQYYEAYGVWFVLVGALAEGLLFINWYVPGSLVIILGIVLAGPNLGKVAILVALITGAFLFTSVVNYFLGRYGWYKLFLKLGLRSPLEKIKSRVEKHGLPIVFTTYFHPNIGALVATSAGILRISFIKFVSYSLLGLIFWNSVLGVAAYFAGPLILGVPYLWLIALALVGWIIYLGVKYYQGQKKALTGLP